MNQDYEMCAVLIEAEVREELQAAKTAEEALNIAFKAGHKQWMYTDEQTRFKGSIGAALIAFKSGPEFDRISRSVRELGKISAMLNALQQGIPVDLAQMVKDREAEGNTADFIPLQKLWNEMRA